MTVAEFLVKVSYTLRGIDDDAPIFGGEESDYWLSVYNTKKNELYADVTKNWASAYSLESVGPIVASPAPKFDLDAQFLAPANRAYVLKLDGYKTYFDFIKPNEAEDKDGIYIAGVNPQTVYFANPIIAGQDIIGGTLYIPGYFVPEDVTQETDDINIPDPNWAVAAVAAELAFADITYEDKGPALNEKANSLYKNMVKLNRRGTYGNPRVAPTRVKRIRSTEVN